MSSDAGGRPEVKGMTGHPPAVCSRVWPRRREKNDDRQLTNGMVERAADASNFGELSGKCPENIPFGVCLGINISRGNVLTET